MFETMMRWILTIFLMILFMVPVQVIYAEPVAENGILDLGHPKHSEEIFFLSGEWEFYWKKLLRTGQFDGQIKPDTYGKVPAYWHSYKEVDGISLWLWDLQVESSPAP